MARYLYSELASAIQARANCQESCNVEWLHRHEDWIEHMAKNLLPSGSGIDCGTRVVLEECHAEKIVLATSFHHMHESGMYDGWTEHTITVTPSFTGGIKLRISGRNQNDIKEFLHQEFECALCADITLEWYQYHFDGVPTWQWHQDTMTGKTSYSVVGSQGSGDVLASFASLDEARAWIVSWCEANRQTLKAKGEN